MTNETIKALKYKNNQIVITQPEQRISRETRDDNVKVLFVRENVRGRMKFRLAISISGPVSPSCETPSSCSGRDKLCISLPAPSTPSPHPSTSPFSPFSLSLSLSLSFSLLSASCPMGEVFRWNYRPPSGLKIVTRLS